MKLKEFIDLPLKYHLLIGTVVRLALIVYGDIHDRIYDVPYTDVDYKVFTDAARHVVHGNSPYKRHTYRYSPLIAYLLVPNIIVGRNFGKILFSIFDILVTVAVKSLVQYQLGSKNKNASRISLYCALFSLYNPLSVGYSTEYQLGSKNKNARKISVYCSLFWLYNPLSVGISTRGNADSVPCFFIILSILFLQTDIVKSSMKYILSGILLGISIHLRLYPLAFSFPMYLSLGKYKINRKTNIIDGIISLLPNWKQITLATSCVVTIFLLTYGMYLLYGYEFLFETYIYHLFRKDTRHNFSVLFYYSYLTMDQLAFDIVKVISQIFECVILFVASLSFGTDPKTLPFALFFQAVVLVAFNSVMTSQYFIWFLSLLPLVVHDFRLKSANALFLTLIWVFAQGAWLFYAYLLEFKCREVFILIWLKSIVFFCANIYVLGQLVKSYSPGYGFGLDLVTNEKNK